MLNLLKITLALSAGWILALAGHNALLHDTRAASPPPPQANFADAGARFVDCMLASVDSGCRLSAGSAPLAETSPVFRNMMTLPNDEAGAGAPFFGAFMIWGLVGLGAMGAGAIWTLRERA